MSKNKWVQMAFMMAMAADMTMQGDTSTIKKRKAMPRREEREPEKLDEPTKPYHNPPKLSKKQRKKIKK